MPFRRPSRRESMAPPSTVIHIPMLQRPYRVDDDIEDEESYKINKSSSHHGNAARSQRYRYVYSEHGSCPAGDARLRGDVETGRLENTSKPFSDSFNSSMGRDAGDGGLEKDDIHTRQLARQRAADLLGETRVQRRPLDLQPHLGDSTLSRAYTDSSEQGRSGGEVPIYRHARVAEEARGAKARIEESARRVARAQMDVDVLHLTAKRRDPRSDSASEYFIGDSTQFRDKSSSSYARTSASNRPRSFHGATKQHDLEGSGSGASRWNVGTSRNGSSGVYRSSVTPTAMSTPHIGRVPSSLFRGEDERASSSSSVCSSSSQARAAQQPQPMLPNSVAAAEVPRKVGNESLTRSIEVLHTGVKTPLNAQSRQDSNPTPQRRATILSPAKEEEVKEAVMMSEEDTSPIKLEASPAQPARGGVSFSSEAELQRRRDVADRNGVVFSPHISMLSSVEANLSSVANAGEEEHEHQQRRQRQQNAWNAHPNHFPTATNVQMSTDEEECFDDDNEVWMSHRNHKREVAENLPRNRTEMSRFGVAGRLSTDGRKGWEDALPRGVPSPRAILQSRAPTTQPTYLEWYLREAGLGEILELSAVAHRSSSSSSSGSDSGTSQASNSGGEGWSKKHSSSRQHKEERRAEELERHRLVASLGQQILGQRVAQHLLVWQEEQTRRLMLMQSEEHERFVLRAQLDVSVHAFSMENHHLKQVEQWTREASAVAEEERAVLSAVRGDLEKETAQLQGELDALRAQDEREAEELTFMDESLKERIRSERQELLSDMGALEKQLDALLEQRKDDAIAANYRVHTRVEGEEAQATPAHAAPTWNQYYSQRDHGDGMTQLSATPMFLSAFATGDNTMQSSPLPVVNVTPPRAHSAAAAAVAYQPVDVLPHPFHHIIVPPPPLQYYQESLRSPGRAHNLLANTPKRIVAYQNQQQQNTFFP